MVRTSALVAGGTGAAVGGVLSLTGVGADVGAPAAVVGPSSNAFIMSSGDHLKAMMNLNTGDKNKDGKTDTKDALNPSSITLSTEIFKSRFGDNESKDNYRKKETKRRTTKEYGTNHSYGTSLGRPTTKSN